MNGNRIAIVGMGLTYPDASTPDELWSNVLAGRRAFRDIPEARTSLTDYWSSDAQVKDSFYSRKAAVLRDYEFDRVLHRVSAGTFRATDMTHWLALDVAGKALADAGFDDGVGLPRDRTGVVIGNTLTGEFTRAGLMRLRWPYVRRVVAEQLRNREWAEDEVDTFMAELEPQYKDPFPEPGEDTLAGGLANTIAGRVCNYFDLGGGGFTVDGACSSSLLAVSQAATSLTEGMTDVALAGGVDLSIDPFELVGFARNGALSTSTMKVYDADSNGFWPGEGCGVVVLMREADAIEQGRRIYACVSGWGVSSDGKGAITRPEAKGHRRAIDQAYERAGYPVDTVSYFEGHGTGTAVGDETELTVLASTRASSVRPSPAAIGTIKANIGHTKAAAGVAGLIKATLTLHHQTIPPITGLDRPHPALLAAEAELVAPDRALPWPGDVPMRAGVSAMGFGGINTHVALEAADPTSTSRKAVEDPTNDAVAGRQDGEVLLFSADSVEDLLADVARTRDWLQGAAMAELADVAASVARHGNGGPARAGVAVTTVEEAVDRLDTISDHLVAQAGEHGRPTSVTPVAPGAFVGWRSRDPRIGFVFPGQGAGRGSTGAVVRRFGGRSVVDEAEGGTAALQPRVVARSLDVADALRRCGVTAQVAVGHSLGEITALVWAEAMGDGQGVRVASERGEAMERTSPTDGAMAVVHADSTTTTGLINGNSVAIAGFNAPEVTVVAGRSDAIDEVCAAAKSAELTASRLNVEHAFHTDDFDKAADAFKAYLSDEDFRPLQREVISTVDAVTIQDHEGLAGYLSRQMVTPVQFSRAIEKIADQDVIVEVGPGRALSGLVSATLPETVVTATDSDDPSLHPFLETISAVHAAGATISVEALFDSRVVRPIDLDREPTFLANPCEAVPELGFEPSAHDGAKDESEQGTSDEEASSPAPGESSYEVLRHLIADKVELPPEVIGEETRPLDELHLSSITVSEIVNDAVRAVGSEPAGGVPSFATATVGEIAEVLDEAADAEATAPSEAPGVAPWARPFAVADVAGRACTASDLSGESRWSAIGSTGTATEIVDVLQRIDGTDGVLVDVRGLADDGMLAALTELFDEVRRRQDAGDAVRVTVLQHPGRGLSGAVKSLHLEHSDVATAIITVPTSGGPELGEVVPAEVEANPGFVEVRYDSEGRRTVPQLTSVPRSSSGPPLGRGDVILATGGAKGITAEACLEIGRRYGVGVALLGRDQADSPSVAATLQRLTDAGVAHHYVSASVLDTDQLSVALAEVEEELGPVTAFLHGAGVNDPKAALQLTEDDFGRALGPKVTGFNCVLDLLDVSGLKLVIGFTSIIGRGGLHGEAHYAMANEWLTADLEALAVRHPHLRVRSLEWSVWAGAGMGERLGVVEQLSDRGIEAVATDQGIVELVNAIESEDFPVTAVICSRTAALPTLTFSPRELSLARFLEREIVHYPGVELIVETELDAHSDPYLPDHAFEGDMLFPAVMGLEAMAQVATNVLPPERYISFRDTAFERPIVVQGGEEPDVVRIASVVMGEDDVLSAAVRTSSSGFAADHFVSTVQISGASALGDSRTGEAELLDTIAVRPAEELYGSVMFQGDRFQKLTSYRQVTARTVTAELDASVRDDWFAGHLPGRLVLGDPGARDALMHALQCCVPNATLLPYSVEQIDIDLEAAHGPRLMHAVEREGDGDWFVYDLHVTDEDGTVVEAWRGLKVRALNYRESADIEWSPAMLGPYLQRGTESLLPGSRVIVVEPAGTDREPRAQTASAARRAGAPEAPHYREDGKPLLPDGANISSSHADELTLTAVGPDPVAVDVEEIVERTPEAWQDLLGESATAAARQAGTEGGLEFDDAATRAWTAMECMVKAGHQKSPIHLGRVGEDGWVVFDVGTYRIATWSGRITGGTRLVAAVLGEET